MQALFTCYATFTRLVKTVQYTVHAVQ